MSFYQRFALWKSFGGTLFFIIVVPPIFLIFGNIHHPFYHCFWAFLHHHRHQERVPVDIMPLENPLKSKSISPLNQSIIPGIHLEFLLQRHPMLFQLHGIFPNQVTYPLQTRHQVDRYTTAN